MEKQIVEFSGTSIPLYSVNILIIGSGAAALSAAVNLFELGQKDIAIATDRWGGGTSNNAGSDKQTYYKLSLCSDIPDSPLQMAEDLFNGKCMHGDIALCEAQNSLPAFFNLVRLGVPFPHDRYGAYVGYKTDHDPRARATSAGPLTSHLMFDALAREVKRKGIPVLDHHEVIALLTETKGDENHVIGAVALDLDNLDSENYGFVVFNAKNVVLGTGGPGGMYEASVYPESQLGSTGMAFKIGAVGQNLTESQFGLASVLFRWNLSGTYQQVIPRYISTDRNGGDEKEFLNEFFPDMGTLATAIFLKGYQWPFDPGKIADYGSSLIDVLVFRETVIKKRRVFLDFKNNLTGSGILEDFSFDLLSQEARDYLEKSGALFDTPIERLQKMNPLAVKLYKDHNIDLSREYLEIAVCAQHNNGGLKGNIWWESNIKHLFPVGEVNGSHGVYRPGGSALNAGQVGGLRSALYISKKYKGNPMDVSTFMSRVGERIEEKLRFASRIIDDSLEDNYYIRNTRKAIRQRMSYYGAHVRDPHKIKEVVSEAWQLYFQMKSRMKIPSTKNLPAAFKNLDLCLTHAVYLEAIAEYLEKGGKSRGSYLVLDAEGEKPCEKLEDEWRFSLNRDDAFVNRKILEISLDESLSVEKKWVDIRPIPRGEQWFENLWEDYREDRIFALD
ncbi:MAG: FAD-binding protein [Candidatus Aminicenantes bacterium]|nr:FAD-binding protein [Candidatus Aminicenantes bacterium]NIM83897.1 FAD-binding protein [Candidatus Aminicenantes bacterium]NIN23363.1 FAD-binding protein [Candidatus Aminicenantes bacterium]NIN47065.1 FAD-binding protein [Candidatus Aminicenantes bacterium]NIN89989.1 FAD-binding protein [Candidatus Aminicenantes bacterium]